MKKGIDKEELKELSKGSWSYREPVGQGFSEWTYDTADNSDHRNCAACGTAEVREHSHLLGEPEILEDGTLLYKCTINGCDYENHVTHLHEYQPGATIATKNPNDVCTKVPYTCECGDVIYEDEKEHQWVEDWLDPNLEECTACGIFREKPTE